MVMNRFHWIGTSLSFVIAYLFLKLNVSASNVTIPKGLGGALNRLYLQYGILVNGFLAFGVLTGILAFIVLFMQLGSIGHNPYMRMFILREMVVVGIVTALIGGFWFFIEFYYIMF